MVLQRSAPMSVQADLILTPLFRQACRILSLTSLAELLTGKYLLSASSQAKGMPMWSELSSLQTIYKTASNSVSNPELWQCFGISILQVFLTALGKITYVKKCLNRTQLTGELTRFCTAPGTKRQRLLSEHSCWIQ